MGRGKYVYQCREVLGWCGPAALSMAFASLGIVVSQKELAEKAPYDPSWGTDHAAMLFGARLFVPNSYEITGIGLDELNRLAKKCAVIANFMDTEQGHEPKHGAGNGEDGHYVLFDKMVGNSVFVMDPNPLTVEGGYRKLARDWFERHFWDIDRGWKVVERWALVLPFPD